MISVDGTALVITALVFALVLVLKHVFFEPLAQAVETREGSISRAERAWDDAQRTIREASARLGAAVQSARNDGYAHLDKIRSEAQATSRASLDRSRLEAQAQIAEARKRLEEESDRAVRQLESDANALAASIASRILGRDVA